MTDNIYKARLTFKLGAVVEGRLVYTEYVAPRWEFHSDCGCLSFNTGFHLTKTMALTDFKKYGEIIE